ncbi:hypothetical protein SAMN03159428_04929 [Kosakonia radicincitans]|uniref:Uncharacterized protein n=1 Tax=Kosakonia radicincitans TaxID=283686 RepID=A0AAX2EZL9_9ENTR|nr:hypothetical protein [Kosakonia radicincitans]SFF38273.1 hypothetical protein SAMN03159468_04956 [Kosakonia radicincitans]SFR26281.1 hypothetical protein SAMN03159514_04916 [Kosakonia radicincitans]SFU16778.1 hypothetical protein SAMN03159428_04929 [Kosakonia radicincitans]SFY32167.1 hypothetical protein SAMN03159436_04906 [Kosakonia radicincitans]
MLHKALSFIARVGIVANLVYLAWPDVCFLWVRALAGDLSLMEWTAVVYMLLFGMALVLAIIAVALLMAFCLLSSAAEILKKYLNLILRDAASLQGGR